MENEIIPTQVQIDRAYQDGKRIGQLNAEIEAFKLQIQKEKDLQNYINNKLLEEFHRLERVIDKRLERIEDALVDARVTISCARHDMLYLLPDSELERRIPEVQELIKQHGKKRVKKNE